MAAPAGSSARVLRVIDAGPGAPEWNMAVDEALLRRPGPPTLRLYSWSPPGLSLGWFQDSAPFLDVPGDHRIVRRRTGGGAIYHDDEITFALTVDAALFPQRIDASYALLHGAVRRALAAVGVDADFARTGAGCLHARPTEPWCFAVPGAHDLVLARTGRKLVGSAQRRLRAPHARVLHHGSIPLRAPQATPFVASIADVADPAVVSPALRAALAAEFAAALDLTPVPGDLDAEERAAAERARDAFATFELRVR